MSAAPRIGVITLPARQWSDQKMTATQVIPRLARVFPTVWMTPPHHWRGIRDRWASRRPVFEPVQEHPGLDLYTAPALLPFTYRPDVARRWLESRRLGQARRHLGEKGCDRIVLYLWRPDFVDALDLVPHDGSLYHIVDEYSFSEEDPPTSAEEQRLIDGVDRLIVHSPALLDKKGRPGVTEFIPNGVDYAAFADPGPEPEDLAGIPGPRIGYCGYIKHQMDWDLIESLIDRHPDFSWVFVGKVLHQDLEPRLASLGSRPRVHFLGPKPSDELARYPQHFDVCIMPYVQNSYTRYIYPLKLHEYLASGRPTVGTPIRSLLDFTDVVDLAEGPEAWSAALQRALRPDAAAADRRARRQEVAHENDWDVLTGRIADMIASIAS